MRKYIKPILATTFTIAAATCVMASPVLQDISAKFNPEIKYTLNGEEILKGQGALVYEDRVYVPVRSLSEVVGMEVDYKDGTVILNDAKEEIKTEVKSTDIKFNNKDYTLTAAFPEEVSKYVTLEAEKDKDLCLIRFEKDGKIANIGSFQFFTEKDYDAMDPKEMPVPTEVLRSDGVVVAFQGLQDMPFEVPSKEADLVSIYHENVGDMLKSVTFQSK